jgi:hypothetical protein
MLSQKDYEGFHAVVRSSSYSSEEFEISTVDYVDRLERLYPDFTRVFVLHKPTSSTMKYVAGCSLYWVRIFEQDVDEGVFRVMPLSKV